MLVKELLTRYYAFKKAKEIEKDLVIFITALRLNLLCGLSLESSLKKAISELKGPLAEEISKIEKDLEKGGEISKALLNSANRIESVEFNRVLSHISEIARSGYSPNFDTLKLLHKEIVENQKVKLREFSSKLVVLSLMFVASVVVLPALWLAFVNIGSALFALQISPLYVWLSVTLVFPGIATLLLIYIKEKMP